MTKSMTKRIATLIDKGLSNKEIIARLKCQPQQVYNTRYYMKKKAEAARMVGRKKVKIVRLASGKNPKPVARPIPTEIVEATEVNAPLITYYEEPSLWQRIKRWFA
jgi:hypothetical protein